MNIYYNKENKRLVVIKKKADENYWETHWVSENVEKQVKLGLCDKVIKKISNKYLPKKGKIVDAGCGVGQNVYALEKYGFESYGIDFAKETIQKTKMHFPNLKVYVQDVRHMEFPDGYFDGYWSLGVIEHFWRGYDEVIKEAYRVLKPGGFVFLTVPAMSLLRRLKAILGLYPIFNNKESTVKKGKGGKATPKMRIS